MPYSQPISRANPASLIFLIDQSGSMDESFGRQPEKKKAHGVADAVNRFLQNTILECTKGNEVRNYFHIGVIGYGPAMGAAFGSDGLKGRDLVLVREIDDNPLRTEKRKYTKHDNAGGLIEEEIELQVWFEPVCSGGTPMCRIG